jgi:DNA recombination protein RmuC
LLGGFAKQWGAFTDGLDKLGRGLESTQRAYDALSTTRRNQLERQLDRVEELRSHRGLQAALAEDRSARLVPLHAEAGADDRVDSEVGGAHVVGPRARRDEDATG